MPVRKTGQLPENIDRQVNEIIRAFSEMEEQVRQIRKASDPRIGDIAEYIDRHVRNLKNPHSVTAKQVKALPLAFVLDQSSICFPFQNSLVSTRGETPIGLYGSSITDYGLVTGNGLCATLLPEGGVAVEEATENLVPDGDVEKTGSTIISYALDVATFKQLEGKVLTVSIDAIDKYDGKHVIDIYLRREDAEGGVVEGTRSSPIHVTSEYRRVSYTFTLPELGTITKLYLCIRGNTYVPGGGDNTGTYTVKNAQIENKPYDTAFVKGSRSWGALDIPTNLSLLQSGTIAFKCWTPKAMEHQLSYYDGAVINVCQGDVRQIDLGMGKGGFNFCVNSATVMPMIPYEPNTKYFVVITWEDGGNPKLYLNGDLKYGVAETFTDPGNGIIQLGRQITTRVNTIRFKNLLICPYAVSPETIATWHSLDAPFYDPREQIDSAGRPVHGAGWEADQNGLRSNVIDPETGRSLFEITPDGNAYFGGVLRAGLVQSTSSVVVAASNASFRMKAGADLTCDGTGDQSEINEAIGSS